MIHPQSIWIAQGERERERKRELAIVSMAFAIVFFFFNIILYIECNRFFFVVDGNENSYNRYEIEDNLLRVRKKRAH